MRSLLLLRASELVLRNERVTATSLRPLSHASWRGTIRKRVSRRGIVRRRDEQSCASLPASFKLRDRLTPKAAAYQLAVQMASKVSLSAIICLPLPSSSSLAIPRSSCVSGAAVARQGDALFTQAALQSCSCTRAGICSACRVAHEARRASAGRAAPHLVGLRGRIVAWSGLWPTAARPSCPHHSAHAHSPFSPTAGASQGPLGAVCSLHARSL